MSITDVTTYAGWIAGLAIVALIATGWRRSARAAADPGTTLPPDEAVGVGPVTETHAPLDRPIPWTKKAWSVAAGFGLAVWVGAAIATVVGFGTAFLVITLTNMLKR